MLDPITAGIVVVLGKYAIDKGAELGKEAGPKALETAKEMFVSALEKLRRTPDGTFVAGKYEEKPEAYEGAMKDELGKVVAEDAAFKSQMELLLKQYDTQAADHAATTGTTYNAVLTGDGAIAQGDGATAVGARGVNVGGTVSGNIVTGDGNAITTNTVAGDYVQGDKVGGDKVNGDKIDVGSISNSSGIAIGRQSRSG